MKTSIDPARPSIVLAGLAVVLAGCVATRGAGDEAGYYAATLPMAVDAVALTFEEARLNIDHHGWVDSSRVYVFNGYAQERLFASSESIARTATFQVLLESVAPDVTQIQVETTQEAIPGMASAAGRTMDYRQRFIRLLNNRLPRMSVVDVSNG